MRKVIFFVLSFTLFIGVAKAEYTDVYFKEKNIKNEEKRYKWYSLVQDGEYYLNSIGTFDIYPYVDKNNKKYGEYSDFTSTYSNEDLNNKDYVCNYNYSYKDIIESKYVVIGNFSNDVTTNLDVTIYFDNEPIKYQIVEYDYWFSNVKTSSSKIVIDLLKYYETTDKLRIDVKLSNDVNVRYNIDFYYDREFIKNTLHKRVNSTSNSFVFDYSWTNNSPYTDIQYSEEEVSTGFYRKILSNETLCKFRDIYTFRYNLIKKYYDNNYYANLDGYLKDDNDYKVYYEYEENIDVTEENNFVDTFLNNQISCYENSLPVIDDDNEVLNLDDKLSLNHKNIEEDSFNINNDLILDNKVSNKKVLTKKLINKFDNKNEKRKINKNTNEIQYKYYFSGGFVLISLILIGIKIKKNVGRIN